MRKKVGMTTHSLIHAIMDMKCKDCIHFKVIDKDNSRCGKILDNVLSFTSFDCEYFKKKK